MERPARDFKGVWIPREIWLSPKLSLMEKVLFVEIHSLDNERGCYASNRYFADFFGMSERQLRRYLVSLRDKGLITMTMKSDTERIIRVRGNYARPTDAEVRAFKGMRIDLTRKLSLQK